MNREELALETEHTELLEALAKAKASGNHDQLREAKEAIYAFRVKWRDIRAAFSIAGQLGVAAPKTLKTGVKPAGGN